MFLFIRYHFRTTGALGAPFPFILGIHTLFLSEDQNSLFSDEIIRVYLDENRIIFGRIGTPPALPERRYKKLLALISEVAPVFERRNGVTSAAVPIDKGAELRQEDHPDKKSPRSGAAVVVAAAAAAALASASGIVSNSNATKGGNSYLMNGSYISSDLSLNSNGAWAVHRLPFFDHAISSVSDSPTTIVNEKLLRAGFLNFFVSILQNYKKLV